MSTVYVAFHLVVNIAAASNHEKIRRRREKLDCSTGNGLPERTMQEEGGGGREREAGET